jgi:hypothetical protein
MAECAVHYCKKAGVHYLAFSGTNLLVDIAYASNMRSEKWNEFPVVRRADDIPSLYLLMEKQVLDFIGIHVGLPEDCLVAIKQPDVISKLYGRRRITANFIVALAQVFKNDHKRSEYPQVVVDCVNATYEGVTGLYKRINYL